MTTRTESYLQTLMKEPGRWITIRKAKDQRSSKVKRLERQEIIKEITAALNIMQIPYELSGTYHIRTHHQ